MGDWIKFYVFSGGNDSVNEIPSAMNCGYGSNSSKKTKLKDMGKVFNPYLRFATFCWCLKGIIKCG